jgi:hypothetical protein
VRPPDDSIKEAANKDVQDMGVGDTLGSAALLEGNPMQGGTLRPSAPTKLLVLELSEYARVLSLVRRLSRSYPSAAGPPRDAPCE